MAATFPQHRVSFVFPCFNEEMNVERTVAAAQRAGKDLGLGAFEIILVNDGSTDGTGDCLRRLEMDFSNVRAVHHDGNQGYGAALRSGISESRMDWVFISDADNQFDFMELTTFLEKATSQVFLQGFRHRRAEGFIRRVNGVAWSWLARRLFSFSVRDVDCAFKLFPREFAQRVPLSATGAVISTELLAYGVSSGLPLIELPVTHRLRMFGSPTGAKLSVIWRAFGELFSLASRFRADTKNPKNTKRFGSEPHASESPRYSKAG